jgi:hypothetical protein
VPRRGNAIFALPGVERFPQVVGATGLLDDQALVASLRQNRLGTIVIAMAIEVRKVAR